MMDMPSLVIIAHNIRSTHNVGAILRTAEGFGVDRCFLTGYTPYPLLPNDTRLPHLSAKIDAAIAKTALGAETMVAVEHSDDLATVVAALKHEGYRIVALEQIPQSISLADYLPADKTALLLGEEVAGVSPESLQLCDEAVVIPMVGQKESFNVSVAAGIAMYALSTSNT
jgi:tRNA G18 (ribose-2'-O)-methylase SpoU